MHALPDLPYSYNALEPHIDETTMRIHHLKHHQAYIDKLNTALEKYPALQKKELTELLKNLEAVPEAIRAIVHNHGGGHWNHSFFWQIMAPADSAETKMPSLIQTALEKSFGSLENFQTQFRETGLNRFGSGWVWLIKRQDGVLAITSTVNQDTPFDQGQLILGADVWEHAYYLKYQNRRGDYLAAFSRVINWSEVARLLTEKI